MNLDNFDINHPITVVAILSVVLGFLTFFIKEVRFWMQATKRSTPTDRVVGELKEITSHLTDIATNIKHLREEFTYEAGLSKRKSDEILERVRAHHESRVKGAS